MMRYSDQDRSLVCLEKPSKVGKVGNNVQVKLGCLGPYNLVPPKQRHAKERER